MRGNISIFNGQHFIDRLSLDPFGCDRARGNGRSTSKGFEFRFYNISVVVHFDLQFHDIPTGGGTDETLIDQDEPKQEEQRKDDWCEKRKENECLRQHLVLKSRRFYEGRHLKSQLFLLASSRQEP